MRNEERLTAATDGTELMISVKGPAGGEATSIACYENAPQSVDAGPDACLPEDAGHDPGEAGPPAPWAQLIQAETFAQFSILLAQLFGERLAQALVFGFQRDQCLEIVACNGSLGCRSLCRGWLRNGAFAAAAFGLEAFAGADLVAAFAAAGLAFDWPSFFQL